MKRKDSKPLVQAEKAPLARVRRKAPRAALTSLPGLLAEMARIYRRARAKVLDHEEARSLIWMLGQMRAAAEAQELARLHARMDEMEGLIEGESDVYRPRPVSRALIEGRSS